MQRGWATTSAINGFAAASFLALAVGFSAFVGSLVPSGIRPPYSHALIGAAAIAVAAIAGWLLYRRTRRDRARPPDAIQSEETLAESAARAVSGMTSDLIGVLEDGRFTSLAINPKELDRLGYTIEELKETPQASLLHPSEVQAVAALVESAMSGGYPVSGTHRARTKKGEWHWFRWSAVPLASDGAITSLAFTARDISVEKRQELVLRGVIEAAPEGLVIANSDGTILGFNRRAEEIFGYRREEIVGQTVESLVPEARRTAHIPKRRAFWERRRGKQIAHGAVQSELRKDGIEYPLVVGLRKDGTDFPAEIGLSRLAIDGPGLVVASIRDVTERVAAEETRTRFETRQAEAQRLESLGRLAGGVAHDFNNLLGAVNNYATLAELRSDRSPGIMAAIEGVRTASRAMAELSAQMLTFAGERGSTKDVVELPAIIREMWPLLRSLVPKKTALRANLDRESPLAWGDRSQLRQVLMNLVSNASEAIGPEGGEIRVSVYAIAGAAGSTHAAQDRGHVCLEVSDSGCGMNPEVRAHALDPFFSTKSQGRGFGLSTVLGIVREHAGEIEVESEPGAGTTIRVLVPRAVPAELGLPQAHPRTPRRSVLRGSTYGAATSTHRILVVEDEDGVRRSTSVLLQEAGFDVRTAVNGREAVRTFRAAGDQIDLVVLDRNMPAMGGEEALVALRRIRVDVPVLLVSGYGEWPAEALDGPTRFMAKPCDPAVLLATIEDLLASGRPTRTRRVRSASASPPAQPES